MANYTCEDTSVCASFQSAVCLHCDRRLCVSHIIEHNRAVPCSIKSLSNEVDTTIQQINNEYEKSRETYNNVLISLNEWRTKQTEKIQEMYENHLQYVESQQEALSITQQELTGLLERDARRPLQLVERQQNASVKVLDHVQQTIKRIQEHSAQLKWNISISLPTNIEPPSNESPSAQISSLINNPSTRKKKLPPKFVSPSAINLRKYRSFKRLVDMFDNISSIEQSKEEIATYIKIQGPFFPLPILVCSYITAWYRKSEGPEKAIILKDHISTIVKHVEHRKNDFVTLLGIHAFFYNEHIQGNKRDLMTFILQHFVDHHAISRRQILNWYTDKDLHGYQGFDGVKQLTAPFIKLLWSATANKVTTTNTSASSGVQTVTTNPITVAEYNTAQVKEEPNVPT